MTPIAAPINVIQCSSCQEDLKIKTLNVNWGLWKRLPAATEKAQLAQLLTIGSACNTCYTAKRSPYQETVFTSEQTAYLSKKLSDNSWLKTAPQQTCDEKIKQVNARCLRPDCGKPFVACSEPNRRVLYFNTNLDLLTLGKCENGHQSMLPIAMGLPNEDRTEKGHKRKFAALENDPEPDDPKSQLECRKCSAEVPIRYLEFLLTSKKADKKIKALIEAIASQQWEKVFKIKSYCPYPCGTWSTHTTFSLPSLLTLQQIQQMQTVIGVYQHFLTSSQAENNKKIKDLKMPCANKKCDESFTEIDARTAFSLSFLEGKFDFAVKLRCDNKHTHNSVLSETLQSAKFEALPSTTPTACPTHRTPWKTHSYELHANKVPYPIIQSFFTSQNLKQFIKVQMQCEVIGETPCVMKKPSTSSIPDLVVDALVTRLNGAVVWLNGLSLGKKCSQCPQSVRITQFFFDRVFELKAKVVCNNPQTPHSAIESLPSDNGKDEV